MIVPPEDNMIIEEVRNISRIDEIPTVNFKKALHEGKVVWIDNQADKYYLNIVKELSLGERENNNKLGVVYTPLHGTGGRLVPKLLRQQGNQINWNTRINNTWITVHRNHCGT